MTFWVFGGPNPTVIPPKFSVGPSTAPDRGSPRCDFLHCAAMPGKRFRPVSRAKACRMLLDAIREAAGEEVFILGDLGKKKGPFEKAGKLKFLARIGWQGFVVWVWLIFWCIGDLLNFPSWRLAIQRFVAWFFFGEKGGNKAQTVLKRLVTSCFQQSQTLVFQISP